VREPSLTVGLLPRFAFRISLVNSPRVFRVREPSLTVGLLPRYRDPTDGLTHAAVFEAFIWSRVWFFV
jgi:hypothetical protein